MQIRDALDNGVSSVGRIYRLDPMYLFSLSLSLLCSRYEVFWRYDVHLTHNILVQISYIFLSGKYVHKVARGFLICQFLWYSQIGGHL
jgi:hypothetical protein